MSIQRLFRCLPILIGLAGSWPLAGQAQAYRRFDDRDGLPQSQVTALLEDRDGFLWAGTGEGVARLGASGFQAFGAAQGLRALDVSDLMQDRAGGIWVASQEGGVDRILGQRVEHFAEAQGLAVTSVNCLQEDSSGAVYAGTRSGLYRWAGGRFEEVPLPDGWSSEPIFAMAPDPRGGLWLGSLKNRLARWDGRNLVPAVIPEAMNAHFRRLQTDASGAVWALSTEALYRREPGGLWRKQSLPGLGRKVRFLTFQITRTGELLLAMEADGVYLHAPGRPPRVITYREGLPREGVASILRDSRGDLWFGTDGAGLLAEGVRGLLGLEKDERGVGLGLGTVLSFQGAGPDRMAIGSTSGLHLWERGKGITGRWSRDQGLPSNQIWALAPRREGGLWVGTLQGLVAWAGGHILKGPKELENVYVAALLEHRGRLWACTYEEGLVELDLTGRFLARHPLPEEVGEPAILAAVPQGNGLLVGTRFGLYAWHDGVFRPALRDTPVGTRSISCLFRGPTGELWVGTAKDGAIGFPQGEKGPWEVLDGRNARIHGRVAWVARNGDGDLVVGHGRGLSLLRRAGGGVLALSRNLGLLSNETSDGSVCLDPGGRLWVGMTGGACILQPGMEMPDPGIPRPRILDATAGLLAFGLPESLDLPPHPGTLTLHFDVARPLLAERPAYQVWMDGAWRSVGEASTVFQIAHLGPGTYPLRVRAFDGQDWAESAPLLVRVQTAWYQTVWARLGGGLGGIVLVLLLAQIQVKRMRGRARILEARVEERTAELTLRNRSLERLHHRLKRSLEGRIQLMNAISHDLRSPLTSIILSVDRLVDFEGLSEEGLGALRVVSSEATRADKLLAHLLDSSRAESITEGLRFRLCHPSEVLEGLSETLTMKAEALELEAHLDLGPIGEAVWVLADAEAMQQVLFNLIENALKFTPSPGRVGIRSGLAAGAWVLEVWDTGRGIEAEFLADLFKPFNQTRKSDAGLGWGLGLSICRALVEAHEGTIRVESEPGQGSLFRVSLPLVAAGPLG